MIKLVIEKIRRNIFIKLIKCINITVTIFCLTFFLNYMFNFVITKNEQQHLPFEFVHLLGEFSWNYLQHGNIYNRAIDWKIFHKHF